jgi:hypothetical protein
VVVATKRGWTLSLGLTVLALPAFGGCGGESNRARDAGDDDAGVEDVIPMKDGVPIGDCRELTAAEQTARGCPAEKPEASSSCDAPEGTTCRYEISTREQSSSQVVFRCSDQGGRNWGAGWMEPCGLGCRYAGHNDVTFDVADCERRSVTSCDQQALLTSAQSALDAMVEETLQACGGPNQVEVEFAGGCPSRLSAIDPLPADIVACLTGALGSTRWSCAQKLVCSSYFIFPTDN